MKVPKDKMLHFCAGVVVATVTVSIAALWIRNMYTLQYIAVWSALIVGIGKELYDEYSKKGTVEYWDVTATTLGGACVALIVLTCF
jgi:type IV secretory pathway TrbL component